MTLKNCKYDYRLGINTGFAVNRFPTPEQWIKVVGEILGLRFVQFTADILNPSLPNEIIDKQIERINCCAEKYNVQIISTMTGAFTRVNHLSHPDEDLRKYWLDWLKKFIDVSVQIGATNMSSHLGILCYEDLHDSDRREFIFQETVKAWKELASYAASKGMEYLCWEPMSIQREYGETIKETKRIQEILNNNTSIPILLCLDVDHGDICSDNPDDTNPYCWLKEFAEISPLIHIKQSCKNKGGHYPFISEYNKEGDIFPGKVLETLKQNGAKQDTTLLLELSFREREPTDSLVLEQLMESVAFWRPYFESYKN